MKTNFIQVFILLASVGMTTTACSQQESGHSGQTTMQDGEEYRAEHVSLDEFHTIVNEGDGQLVDVRRPEEYAAGHAAGAVNINYLDDGFLENALAGLEKDKAVYLYCASGNRSSKAMQVLSDAGFKEIYNLRGAGFRQWESAGYPVEK